MEHPEILNKKISRKQVIYSKLPQRFNQGRCSLRNWRKNKSKVIWLIHYIKTLKLRLNLSLIKRLVKHKIKWIGLLVMWHLSERITKIYRKV